MLFSLKLQRNDRKNAPAVAPAKGKTGKKAVFSPYCGGETATYSGRAFSYCFYIVMMPIGKALSEYMVVLFQQYTENICFFSKFSAGGLCDWGIFLVISLEFQGNKASTVFYDTAKINSLPAESLSPVFAASCMVRRFIGFTA